jgi:phosphatidate phosphatase APP1
VSGVSDMVKTTTVCLMLAWGVVVSAAAEEARQVIMDDAWSGATGAHFSGRLTEVRNAPTSEQGRVTTLYRNTRLLLTSGEEGAVTWRVGDLEWTVRADEEGYWELAMNRPLPLAPGWHEITSEPAVSSAAGLLVVDPENRFGIISDVDDTVLVSGVVEKRTLLKNSLTVPPERREAVPGMAELYHRLLKRNLKPEASAVFYVSASPKQLTDNLRGFLGGQGFPRGVLRLKELSEASGASILDPNQQGYKLRALEAVLLAYPQVRFTLFGDDGEQDPEIYAALQKKFPAQIEAVWIRRVDPNPARERFEGQGDTVTLLVP